MIGDDCHSSMDLGVVRWRDNDEVAKLQNDGKAVTSSDGDNFRHFMTWILKTQQPQLEGSSFQLQNGFIPEPPKERHVPSSVARVTKRLAAEQDSEAWTCVVCKRQNAAVESACRVCFTKKDYKFRTKPAASSASTVSDTPSTTADPGREINLIPTLTLPSSSQSSDSGAITTPGLVKKEMTSTAPPRAFPTFAKVERRKRAPPLPRAQEADPEHKEPLGIPTSPIEVRARPAAAKRSAPRPPPHIPRPKEVPKFIFDKFQAEYARKPQGSIPLPPRRAPPPLPAPKSAQSAREPEAGMELP